ncbi:hypothetical protein B9Z65_3849 [Elsinoe australis]|uniref:Uncharacterized protein n=1 Tax=Elsinoe australis TaxID=40998 RepID=A0A2P8A2R4_9PEZI|nr:hypothetical protein B9Z65_3849 [Elsinoe australis]
MAPKRSAGTKEHTGQPASKRQRKDVNHEEESDESEGEVDTGRLESEATIDRTTRGNKGAKQNAWGKGMRDKIQKDADELNALVDALAQERKTAFVEYKSELDALRPLLQSGLSTPTTQGSPPTSASGLTATPNTASHPPLDRETTTLLASCTALLSSYTQLNADLATISTQSKHLPDSSTPVPTPSKLQAQRSQLRHLLMAGHVVTARKAGRIINPDVDVFVDGDETSPIESEQVDKGRQMIVNGTLVRVFNVRDAGKENRDPALAREGGGDDRRPRITAEDEDRWTRLTSGTFGEELGWALRGGAGGPGKGGMDAGLAGDDAEEEVSIRRALRDMQRGVRRMVRNLPKEMDDEEMRPTL